jgi:hypothetical protein
MATESTLRALNRLLAIHQRSLAMYLGYASPTWHRGDEEARRTLEQIVADHEATVERLGEMIMEAGGVVAPSAFPTVFTGYHDLSFEFLLVKLLEYQRRHVAIIEGYVQQLATAPAAKAAAEEALGQAKAHLEMLQELQRENAAAGK